VSGKQVALKMIHTATVKITLYIGRWNETDYAYALNADEAIASVKRHFAYGDPAEDEYAVGEEWATDDADSGWRILTQEIDAPIIDVELKKGDPGDTAHVIWSCPACGKAYSDDWHPEDKMPVLLLCCCDGDRKILIGVCDM